METTAEQPAEIVVDASVNPPNVDKKPDETQQVLAETIPVAKEILSIISQNDYDIGKEETLDQAKQQALAQKVFDCLRKHDIRYTDRNLVQQLMMQAIEIHFTPALKLMDDQYSFAVAKALGKDKIDLKMSDIEAVIKM